MTGDKLENNSQQWLLLTGICLTTYAVFYTSTAIATVIVPIANEFHSKASELQWVLSSYFLTVACLVVLGGRLGDIYGRNRLYLLGIFLIAISLIGSALAPNTIFLIITRVTYGMGTALAQPISLSLMKSEFSPKMQKIGFTLWGTVGGLATSVSPFIAGAISSHSNWRWAICFCLPFAIGGLICSGLALGLKRAVRVKARIDFVGTFFLGIGAAMLLVFLDYVRQWGIDSFLSIGCLVLSFVGFVFFFITESKVKEPLIRLNIFNNRTFIASLVTIFCMNFITIGFVYVFSLYFQNYFSFRFSAYQAGTLYLFVGIACFISSLNTKWLIRLISTKWTVVLGLLCLTAGALYFALVTNTLHYEVFFAPLIILGIGVGLLFGPSQEIAMDAVAENEVGQASGVTNIVRYLACALGISVSGSLYYYISSLKLADFLRSENLSHAKLESIEKLIIGHKAFTGQTLAKIIDPIKRHVFMVETDASLQSGLAYSMYAIIIISLISLILATFLIKGKKQKPKV